MASKKKKPAAMKITVKSHTRKFNAAKLPPRRKNGKWTQKRQLTLL